MAKLKHLVSIGTNEHPCLVFNNESFYKQETGVPHVIATWVYNATMNLLDALDLYPKEPGTILLNVKIKTVEE